MMVLRGPGALLICFHTWIAVLEISACQFGPNCTYPCHCLNNASCDPITGECPDGACDDGNPHGNWSSGAWYGPACQIGNAAYNKPAEQWEKDYNGNVASRAVDGNWTQVLSEGHCSHTHGSAPSWWQVDLGQQHVILNLIIYNRVDYGGECETNSFGAGCVTSCNCDGRCDLINGSCPGNCTPGWVGDDCQQPCTDGAWGPMCSESCNCLNTTEICDHVSGRCSLSGCATHYVGIGCDVEFPPYDYELIVLSTSATSVDVSFITWSNDTGSGVPPAGYVLKWRQVSNVTWVEAVHLLEERQSYNVTYMFEDLEPSTQYMFMVCPYIVLEDAQYEGNSSYIIQQTFQLLEIGSPPETHVAVIVSVLFLAIIVIIASLLLRYRHRVPYVRHLLLKSSRTPPSGDIEGTEGSNTPAVNSTADDDHQYEDVRSYENVGYTNDFHLPSNPIIVHNIPKYIQEKKKSLDAFKNEFENLPKKQTAEWEVARTKANIAKNRFDNICAYDHCRVVLPLDESETCTDYINANYIPGYKDDKAYIATQGPKSSTIVDLWRMIWSEDINRLVTVGKPVEAGKVKYEAYWPTGELLETTTVGDFTVKLQTNQEYADFTVRKLSLLHRGQSRPLTQFHFMTWPDHGVPEMATSLLEFHRKVRGQDDIASGPMLVHCSAGIGRTGTFIAIDYLLDQAHAEGQVDVLQCVALMRNYRINMVQTLDQYVFIHNALLQALIAGETAIPSHKMEQEYPKLQEVNPDTQENILQKQFQALVGLKPICDRKNPIGLLEANQKKNYSELIIPANNYRPCLSTQVPGTNDYINAVYVAGYRNCRAYILTQRPLAGTVQDFWRLVYDHGCHSSVLLDTIDSVNQECPALWPTNVDDNLVFGPLTIKKSKEEPAAEDILIREFTITRRKETEPVTLRQFVLHGWQETQDVPPSMGSLLTLMELLERWQQRTGNQPIIMQCRTGVHHSGVFCAASYMIEKLKLDQEVDVFHSVARVRTFRPQMIVSLEQYAFLYDLALDFIQSHATYSNFK